ncbi:MAG: beta-ketoacyl-[acyl-carrier-protein] synthase family protein [Candidatus Cyclobacteriaceae bacterium M2_1C_046]
MSSKVYITGIGIISALGNGVEKNLYALVNASPGIDYPQFLKTEYRNEFVTGEVKHGNEELAALAGLNHYKKLSRTASLGLIAAREAVSQAGLTTKELLNAGFFNGTSVGGMDISENYYEALKKNEDFDYAAVFSGHDCGSSTEIIGDYLGIKGYISTISTACSSSANTIMHAGRLIKAGKLDIAIAGGTDALSKFTLNGFNSLKILDPGWCRPFDADRQGLNLGEGAAYVILESEESIKRSGRPALAELSGYGNANDAFHQTASSPEGKGANLAMQKAMKMAGDITIDYINAHGTGTGNNDQSESMAIKMMFGQNTPDYSSTKALTGHTLGAAGGIEAVFSVLALQHNLKFPNLNITTPMDTLEKKPLQKIMKNDQVNSVLSNSFGFGGNCTSLIFRK